MKRESSKKMKLRSGGRFGTIFSEKLSEEDEKYNENISKFMSFKDASFSVLKRTHYCLIFEKDESGDCFNYIESAYVKTEWSKNWSGNFNDLPETFFWKADTFNRIIPLTHVHVI